MIARRRMRLARLVRFAVATGALVLLAFAAPAAASAPRAVAPGPSSAPEYWFDQWQIPQLRASGVRGQGVVIAEIDTGVNASLPELAGKVLPGKDFGTFGGDGRVDRDVTDFGHGTAMASIMVGSPNQLGIEGIAPDAKVLPIAIPLTRTTDASGDDHLASAIRWSVDNGARIISMSLGGTRQAGTDALACPADEQSAIYYALGKGAVLIAAAGNRGQIDNAVEQPGVCLGVLAVGAVDQNAAVAAFSSRQPYLAFTAPGVNIASLSRIPGAAYHGDGTSQSAAISAAVTALVWSKYPALNGAQVVSRILATLDSRSTARSTAYGYGVLNGYRAVTAAVSPNAANPIYAAVQPFLARAAAARNQATSAPAKRAVPVSSLGSFSVAAVHRWDDSKVLVGGAVALAGLLALAGLAVVPRRQRRGRVTAGAASDSGLGVELAATSTATSTSAQRGTAQPSGPDQAVLTWHEIIPPD